jgi:hypothetical protein
MRFDVDCPAHWRRLTDRVRVVQHAPLAIATIGEAQLHIDLDRLVRRTTPKDARVVVTGDLEVDTRWGAPARLVVAELHVGREIVERRWCACFRQGRWSAALAVHARGPLAHVDDLVATIETGRFTDPNASMDVEFLAHWCA